MSLNSVYFILRQRFLSSRIFSLRSFLRIAIAALAVAILYVGAMVIVGIFSTPPVYYPVMDTPAATSTSPQLNEKPLAPVHATSSVWFVGDIMLSRDVGRVARGEGYDFPWRLLGNTFDNAWVVGNFEACVATSTQFSREQNMRFPVELAMIPPLRAAGFTHLSLANNHALDCGTAGFLRSRSFLEESGLVTFGHPTALSSSSISYLTVGTTTVALVGIHTLFSSPTQQSLAAVFASAASSSDMQIAYVHWGTEYVERAGASERTLANTLVTLGADLVIGHHPHVVQDIALVSGVPVVYSLGNFIFDQYFSREVQEGLALKLELGHAPQLTLVPFSSRDTRTQTQPMDATSTTTFLEKVAMRSDPSLAQSIKKGVILLAPQLATSTEIVMMAE